MGDDDGGALSPVGIEYLRAFQVHNLKQWLLGRVLVCLPGNEITFGLWVPH